MFSKCIAHYYVQNKAKGRTEEMEMQMNSIESNLRAELGVVKRERDNQVELYQRLERECAQREADANSAFLRMDSLQVFQLSIWH